MVTITKGRAHIIIPIMVGQHYRFYECEPHVSISKDGHHIVIAKCGSHGHNNKRWAHIIIPIMVGPYYKFYECRLHILISKGGHHVVISKCGSHGHNNKR